MTRNLGNIAVVAQFLVQIDPNEAKLISYTDSHCQNVLNDTIRLDSLVLY